jgi:hypothetical protein
MGLAQMLEYVKRHLYKNASHFCHCGAGLNKASRSDTNNLSFRNRPQLREAQ